MYYFTSSTKRFYQRKAYSLSFIFLCIFFSFQVVQAAEFRFSDYPSIVHSGDRFSVSVRLGTQRNSVNAVEGRIVFSPNLKINNIEDGQSLIGVWTERARVSPGDSGIPFSGIIPGGYSGENGPVFTLDLEAQGSGLAKIELTNLMAFGNDGAATPVSVSSSPFVFTIDPSTGLQPSLRVPDLSPPDSFTPEVSRSEELFDNKYFLVFQTTDKQSGIDHYEVAEVSTLGKTASVSPVWQEATSPHLLGDQTLRSDIYVRAVDRSGNFIVVKLSASSPGTSAERFPLFVWIAGFLLCLLVLFSFLNKLRSLLNNKDTK